MLDNRKYNQNREINKLQQYLFYKPGILTLLEGAGSLYFPNLNLLSTVPGLRTGR